jgi:hypothetical protein
VIHFVAKLLKNEAVSCQDVILRWQIENEAMREIVKIHCIVILGREHHCCMSQSAASVIFKPLASDSSNERRLRDLGEYSIVRILYIYRRCRKHIDFGKWQGLN